MTKIFLKRLSATLAVFASFYFVPSNPCVAEDPSVLYVHAIKADLKADPRAGATALAQLKRGTMLRVDTGPPGAGSSTQPTPAHWYRVKYNDGAQEQSGYVSKLFVKSHPPVGQADLDRDVQGDSLEKTSRRRSSSYSASAATRGYTESTRTRVGRAEHGSDEAALSEVDRQTASTNQVDQFRKPIEAEGKSR